MLSTWDGTCRSQVHRDGKSRGSQGPGAHGKLFNGAVLFEKMQAMKWIAVLVAPCHECT